jgi:hypothetical protein
VGPHLSKKNLIYISDNIKKIIEVLKKWKKTKLKIKKFS